MSAILAFFCGICAIILCEAVAEWLQAITRKIELSNEQRRMQLDKQKQEGTIDGN